jgi:hypothetical protein
VDRGVLNQILPRSAGIKASLYAEDAAIFFRPSKQDVAMLKEILDMFGEASGLHTNIQKSEVFPIGYNDLSKKFLTLSWRKLAFSPLGIWAYLFI